MEQTTIARPAPPSPARPSVRALHEAGAMPGGAPYETEIPRPEFPRPDFERKHWVNLNGRWRFTFDPRNLGEQQRWYRVPHPAVATYTGEVTSPVEDPFGGEIIVPFPWESRLSGVCDPSYKGAAWYQRSIIVPAEWAVPEPPPPSPAAAGASSAAIDGTGIPRPIARREVRWRLRPYLCFGAVDWNAKVWINGQFVTEHDGGYTPFCADISRFVRPGVPATLTVRAYDACDADTPLGKQVEEWYTHSGGIWQTVWLEGRPPVHIAHLQLTPQLEPPGVRLAVTLDGTAAPTAGTYRLSLQADDGSFPPVHQPVSVPAGGQASATLEVPVPQPRLWSPDDPHLYPCTLRLTPVPPGDQASQEAPAAAGAASEAGRAAAAAEAAVGAAGRGGVAEAAPAGGAVAPTGVADEVHTYFGLRRVSTGRWEGRPYEYVLLNGQPVYLRGVLDQGFHPEGLYSYPSEAALRADLEAAKRLGFNLVRCHIKINEPRYYYWADRLGLLIMYDFPSASIYTPKARANWERTFREALARDASHPSIIAWILFNETWGLEEHRTPAGWRWVKEMYYLAKQLDPTRLVEDNSPYLWDHVTTDINTWHFYLGDYDRARRHIESVVQQTFEGSPFHYVGGVYGDIQGAEVYRQGTQPLLNSEYAGLSAWGGDRDISYSFKFLTTELRRHEKICGYVYTELTDVEWEHNGLLNYDRTTKEFGYEAFVPGMTVADLNGADGVGFDAPPCQTLPPGGRFRAPVFISHWSHQPLGAARLRWTAWFYDRFGERHELPSAAGERIIEPRQYGVTEAGEVEVALPDEVCLLTIGLVLVDEQGEVRARNYVNVNVYSRRLMPPVERTEHGWVVRFLPGDFMATSWMDPRLGPRGSKFGAAGAGWVDYSVALPDEVEVGAIRRLRLRFEAGARTAKNRVDWKDMRHVLDSDYPQTEQRKLPSEVVVWINGVRLGRAWLPDDPADSRGVLSLLNSDYWEAGSYGFLIDLGADERTTRRILSEMTVATQASPYRFAAPGTLGQRLLIRFEVPAGGPAGGLNLYGARMGAYPIDPMVFLDL